jgi:transcription elongation factor GreA
MNTHVFTTTNEQPTLLSKKGMKELKKRITQLEHDQTVLIRSLHEMERTNTHDERLERIERLAQLESIESELFDKKSILEHAKLLPTRRARMKVALGSVVDLIDQQGKLMRFTLVDSIEANPSDGRISVASPLGSQLVGKSVTDTVEWDAKMKHQRMQLVNIH